MGPALGRVVTERGTLAELSTADGRALPAGVWSSAARRALRPGPARVTATKAGTVTGGQALGAANRCPPHPVPSDDGITLIEKFDDLLAEAVDRGQPDPDALAKLAAEAQQLADRTDNALHDIAVRLARAVAAAAGARRPAPYGEALALLAAAAGPPKPDERRQRELNRAMIELLERFNQPGNDPRDLIDLLTALLPGKPPEEPPCEPVDLGALATGVRAAFDPTSPTGAARTRVLGLIDGLDPAQPLAPPEACVGIDRPVWRDVDKAFKEWLLPGVKSLPDDSVIALETNPTFVDSLLVGLNSQLLNELRWRNIPVSTGCTPLRSFWQRADPATGQRVDDIVGVVRWAADTGLGDLGHRPGGASGRDLVVVVRGRLFLRYPATVVYLVSAEVGGTVHFDLDPPADAVHILPTFQGRIGADVTFFGFQGFDPARITRHWLVFEEPPAGYRFANDVSSAPAPERWAAEAFARPVRVLIRGDHLDPEDV